MSLMRFKIRIKFKQNKKECIIFTINDNINLMHISARNKYIVKVSMVKYTQINAYLAKKSPDTQTKAKIPRSSEKSPAVATLVSYQCQCSVKPQIIFTWHVVKNNMS